MERNDKQQFECCSTCSSRSFGRNQDRSTVAENPCRPLMDGRSTFLTSDQSGIIDRLSTQVSSLEEAETSREDKRASLHQATNRLCDSSVDYPFEEGEFCALPYLLKWKKVYDATYWFRPETCSCKRTSAYADSTNEILYHKKTHESQAVEKVTLQCKFARDRSGQSTDTTEAKTFFNQLMWRQNIHRNLWAQHEETRH